MAAANHTLDRASLDGLESLHSAYVGLEVLAGMADADSHHVASVLAVLNQAFLDRIDSLSPKPFGLWPVGR